MKQIPAPHSAPIVIQYFQVGDQESACLTNLPGDSDVGGPRTVYFILIVKASLADQCEWQQNLS